MTVIEPNISDGARLPIGKAAQVLGISRETLRLHTDEGRLKCRFNPATKRRVYSGREIKRYWRESL